MSDIEQNYYSGLKWTCSLLGIVQLSSPKMEDTEKDGDTMSETSTRDSTSSVSDTIGAVSTPDNVSLSSYGSSGHVSSDISNTTSPAGDTDTTLLSDNEGFGTLRNMSHTDVSPNVEDVKKLLTCSACNDTFDEPKLLVCLHTFCEKCIQTYREVDTDYVICGYCRTCQPKPRDGSKGLTPSYTHEDLLETMKRSESQPSMCQACEKNDDPQFLCTTCNVVICKPCQVAHANLKITKKHTVLPLSQANETPLSIYAGKRQVICKEHDEAIAYRCVPCGLFLCHTDLTKYHQDHEIETVAEVRHRMKRNAAELERKVKQSILSSKSAETLARCRKERLNEKFEAMECRIDTVVNETERCMRQAATSMKAQLRQQKGREEEKIREVMGETEERLQSSQHLRRMLLSVTKESNDLDALTFLSYCEQSYEDFRQRGTGQKTFDSDIVFLTSSRLSQILTSSNIGEVREIGNYPAFKTPQVFSTFNVLENVSGMAANVYGEVVCTSYHEGKCVMYDKTGKPIRDLSAQVVRPWDVAFTDDNTFVITDCGDNIGHGSVKLFSPAGTLIKVIAANVKSPAGVTIDRSGRLYVCDEHETCVKILSMEGNIIGQLKSWNDNYLFQGPIFVATNVNNDVIVCDDHRTIKIMSSVGEVKEDYEVDGRHDLQAICTDDSGQILVVDNMMNGLHVLTAGGRLRRFVSFADIPGLENARCVCIDPSGRVVIGGRSKLVVLDIFEAC
ncbi:tripartite motif-containing protein 2-like isoform X1 [Haliotis cracherodii]|uniref:tripartite motif-containing protein 2-like isoform X1 n=1 Tax=Haliotis cracherodii TaxID=6455 RepID=UPI0039E9318E